MQLTDQQATSILVEGLARGLFEPAVPTEESDRLLDATKLVEACEIAHKAGNKSDNVETILFMSQVNSDAVLVDKPNIDNTIILEKRDTETNNMHNGLNLAELSDGILDQLIVGLDQYPQTDEVETDRRAYTAEKERRGNAQTILAQDLPQAEAPQAPPEEAGEAPSEGAATQLQAEDQISGVPGGENGSAGAGTEVHDQQDSGQGEDASAFARAQTPETSGKEKSPKAKSQEKDGERAELEAKLNYDMVKAHNTDLISLSKAPINELRYIVENPSGPQTYDTLTETAPKEEDKVPIVDSEVKGVASDKEGESATGIVAVKSVEQKIVTKADLGLNIVDDEPEENRTGISKDRETLESLLTGPCLKVYGRGRKEVPSIGDNELRLMVLNSSVKASDDEIEKAQMMDGKIILVLNNEEINIETGKDDDEPQDNQGDAEQIVETDRSIAEEAAAERVVTKSILPDQDRSIAEAATEIGNIPPKEVYPIISQDRYAAGENPTTNVELPSGQTVKVVTEIPKMPDIVEVPEEILAENKPLTGQARAMEIINKEGMPIPPEISDPAPILPADVSKCSRDELFSYHARYHAYESRMNWILSSFEDELGDIEKLRRVREIDVAASIPLLAEDGKRITNEARDAQVAADSLVIQYYEEEHEKKKTVNKLKVLQRNYMKDCERISRQMSKYEREKQDAPR